MAMDLYGGKIWLSMNDLTKEGHHVPHENLTCRAGYQPWHDTDPDGGNYQNCVYFDNQKIADHHCHDDEQKVICQRPNFPIEEGLRK